MKTLGIIGSGDLGRQIAHYATSDAGYSDVVFFDDVSNEKSSNGFPIIGTSDDVEKAFAGGKFDELTIGIGYRHLKIRKEIFERFFDRIPFATVIHSTVWVDPTAKIGQGSVIYPGCVIDAHSTIGNNCILNVSCAIAHDTEIGNHSFLSPRVAVAGFVKVAERCIIGLNATVIDNISIVSGTQIGGGTVVIKNIDQSGLYVGNPHKFIR